MEHDIAGASGAGLASCLVRTGIFAEHPAAKLDGIAAGYDIRHS
ncbi:MAG: HAD hydrolase-like protein [Rhizobiales bacterium]|nr:HAD hydrolase-like protein [Hyphomicrobiales bacterium]